MLFEEHTRPGTQTENQDAQWMQLTSPSSFFSAITSISSQQTHSTRVGIGTQRPQEHL